MPVIQTANGRGVYMALIAGFCAAFASIFAKTAVSEDGAHNVASLLSYLAKSVNSHLHRVLFGHDMIVLTLLVIRGTGVLGIFASNALMWICFSKALQLCSSSVVATVTNTAANFFFTACVSWLLFEETLPVLWWCGSSLILAGLLLVHHGSRDKAEDGLDMNPANKKTV
ncbi:uncharacterized protein LOC143300398 [Babylonia areolata]|uniref:uncharacterized protein LOC143300398 n=1 Tax=Babylonia areolata TaxID=304850 RepID=UPI003FD5B131